MSVKKIKKVVNKGITDKIPTEYKKELVKANYKYIEKFAKNYPNKYSLACLEKYKNY